MRKRGWRQFCSSHSIPLSFTLSFPESPPQQISSYSPAPSSSSPVFPFRTSFVQEFSSRLLYVSERRRSCASYVCARIEKSGGASVLRKGGETVDSNGSSMLFGSVDLNEVCAARVGTLEGEVGLGESSSRCLGGVRHTKTGITDSKHYGGARFNFL